MSNFHNESDDRREGRSGGPRRDGSGGKFYQKFVPSPDSQQNDNGPAERGNRRDDKPRGERSFGNARRRDDDRPRTGQGNDRDSGNRRFSSDRNNDRREPRSNRDDNRSGERSPRSFDSGRRDDSRPFNRDDNRRSESRPFNRDNDARPFNRDNDRRTDSRPFNRDDNRGNESRPFNRSNDRRDDSRPFNRDDRGERRPFRDSNANSDQPQRRDNRFGNERSFGERSGNRFDGPRRDGDAPRERRDDSRGFQRSNRDDQRPAGTRGRARREGGYQDNEPRFDPAGPRRKTFGWTDQADENRSASRPDAEDDNRFNRRDDDRPAGRDRDRSRDSRFERPRRDDRSSGGYRNDRSDRFDRSSDSRRSGTDREDAQERRRIEDSRDRQVGTSRVPNYDVDRMKSKLPRNNKKVKQIEREDAASDGSIRLNRYIANSGICSRRDADALIANGDVSVNGNVVIEMGYKVQPGDTVKYGNRVLNPEKMMYVLLNKPKDYITTTEDPNDRNTVMDLVAGATPFRIYPVGRLDRNTTGLLLLTNDGELVEKLTHPSHNIKKVYQVEIDKPLTDEHFEAIKAGVELEDGLIKPDDLGIVTPDAQVIGIEIHSGRNRIVRRIFEHFGYEVTKLDRTVYAGLNKKDLPRGKWRYLSEKEVIRLKFLL